MKQQQKIQKQKQISQNNTFSLQFNELSYQKHLTQQCCIFSLSLNFDGQFIIAGIINGLKIWGFENGDIININIKLSHSVSQCTIGALVCSKMQNCFFSGDLNGNIIYWKENNGKWQISFEQQISESQIIQLKLTKDEQQILMSTYLQIKTYYIDKLKNTLKFIQQLDLNGRVDSISLNFKEDLLLSCSNDYFLILWKKKDDLWTQIYQKKEENNLNEATFISDNQFILSISSNKQLLLMQVSEKNNIEQIFSYKMEQDQLNIMFCHYLTSLFLLDKQILFKKHQHYISIFQKINNKLTLKKVIKLQTINFYGTILLNGQILILSQFDKIQVYQLEYQY